MAHAACCSSYANHSIGISHSAHDNLCANNIFINGSEEQRRRFLPGLCDGSLVVNVLEIQPATATDAPPAHPPPSFTHVHASSRQS